MNCEEFELLLADELGGELDAADRTALEVHAASCAACRRERESLAGAVATLRALPSAPGVRVERMGDRLVLTPTTAASARPRRPVNWSWRLLRYAAGVAFAFLAGYLFHALNSPITTVSVPRGVASTNLLPGRDLQSAVAAQFARNPGRSDLANGLLAMYHPQ